MTKINIPTILSFFLHLILLVFEHSIVKSQTLPPLCWVDKYNVTWDSPSKNQSGSMPIGNGDIGLNVWVENEDLLFYIGKTDDFDENATPLKLGRVRVHFSQNQPIAKKSFQQTLHLGNGEITIQKGDGIKLRVWVDANHPIIHVESNGAQAFTELVSLETWRDTARTTSFMLTHSDMFQNWKSPSVYQSVFYPDTVFQHQHNNIRWCHENPILMQDPFTLNMEMQGLGGFVANMVHPLQHRIFGCAAFGDGFVSNGAKELVSEKASTSQRFEIYALTEHPVTIGEWNKDLQLLIDSCQKLPIEELRLKHQNWWSSFWERSMVDFSQVGASDIHGVYDVARAYNLCRFMNACAGRGLLPIKYNGSIFTVGTPENPDFRRWGGPGYWLQNNRLVYWPMLEEGDFDLMLPWFQMYHDILPLNQYKTKLVFHHDGAFFPETITFWGSQVSIDYGWDIPFEKRKNKLGVNPYTSYYWQGGIEQGLMMLNYFEYTQDTAFAKKILLPHIDAITEFYNQHYQLDNKGKMVFAPAASLETWHVAINPTPDIAGLAYLLSKLQKLPKNLCTDNQFAKWDSLTKQLPAIPLGEKHDSLVVLPALAYSVKKNKENPELYTVFPYKIYGLGKPDLQTALNTFKYRDFPLDSCWSQNIIQAALLGLTDTAKAMAIDRARPSAYSDSRFPAFFNSFNDWVPDIDHGGALQIALNNMLMQCEGKEIRILPAWPKDWDVHFKLHAPYNTTVECTYTNGKIVSLQVIPKNRVKDLVIE